MNLSFIYSFHPSIHPWKCEIREVHLISFWNYPLLVHTSIIPPVFVHPSVHPVHPSVSWSIHHPSIHPSIRPPLGYVIHWPYLSIKYFASCHLLKVTLFNLSHTVKYYSFSSFLLSIQLTVTAYYIHTQPLKSTTCYMSACMFHSFSRARNTFTAPRAAINSPIIIKLMNMHCWPTQYIYSGLVHTRGLQ